MSAQVHHVRRMTYPHCLHHNPSSPAFISLYDIPGAAHRAPNPPLDPRARHASLWGNCVAAMSGSFGIVVARLTCVWRSGPAVAASAAPVADSVQFDIVCRHVPRSSGSSSSGGSSSIVCIDVDAQSYASVRHIWCVTSDGTCHVISASAPAAAEVSMRTVASSGGGGSISSDCHVAVLPRSPSDDTCAAIYSGFAVTMWSYSSGGLVVLWKVGARERADSGIW